MTDATDLLFINGSAKPLAKVHVTDNTDPRRVEVSLSVNDFLTAARLLYSVVGVASTERIWEGLHDTAIQLDPNYLAGL